MYCLFSFLNLFFLSPHVCTLLMFEMCVRAADTCAEFHNFPKDLNYYNRAMLCTCTCIHGRSILRFVYYLSKMQHFD